MYVISLNQSTYVCIIYMHVLYIDITCDANFLQNLVNLAQSII